MKYRLSPHPTLSLKERTFLSNFIFSFRENIKLPSPLRRGAGGEVKILLFLLLALLGCEKTEISETSTDSYFPLKKNHAITYSVTETEYGILSGKTEKNYFLKEVVGDSIGTYNQASVYKIERYKRNSTQDNWKIDSVWTAYNLPDKSIKVENNIAFVKLFYPLSTGSKWNGNLYNQLPAENYLAKQINSNFGLSGVSSEGFEIIQKQDSSAVTLQKKKEVYLKNVGMVYQEKTNFEYCQSSPNCIGKGIVETGKSIVMKAVAVE